MAKTLSKTFLVLLFAAGTGFGAAAMAADDPGIHQVYEAANSGHLDQARTMMSQVLKDHPESGKAHYVAAEIDARSGDFASARSEFQTAEKLAPGLPFAKAGSVQELRNQLYPQTQVIQQPRYPTQVTSVQPIQAHHGFPWGTALGIAFLVWIVWLIFRRFTAPTVYNNSYGGGYRPGGAAPGGYYGGGYPPPSGGPGLLGSLGTGLAVGAGVVAGEEIAERLLDGGRREGVVERDVVYRDDPPQNQNSDMGGNDFGISDNSSWDSGDSGGIGGSDDSWS